LAPKVLGLVAHWATPPPDFTPHYLGVAHWPNGPGRGDNAIAKSGPLAQRAYGPTIQKATSPPAFQPDDLLGHETIGPMA
jgi:hypothetical protein